MNDLPTAHSAGSAATQKRSNYENGSQPSWQWPAFQRRRPEWTCQSPRYVSFAAKLENRSGSRFAARIRIFARSGGNPGKGCEFPSNFVQSGLGFALEYWPYADKFDARISRSRSQAARRRATEESLLYMKTATADNCARG
jgi:hypothetical protein